VYQPPNIYPDMLGGVGNLSIVVAGVVTVLVVGLGISVMLSGSLNWLLKATVYVTGMVEDSSDGIVFVSQAMITAIAVKRTKIEIIFTEILMFSPK
jgi:hypothetical protein